MEIAAQEALPNDVEALKQIINNLQDSYQHVQRESEKRISILEEQVQFFKNKLFGRRAESWSESDRYQMRLFNEAEAGVEEESTAKETLIKVATHSRRKRGRKPLPDSLPRKDEEHDLSEEEKICGCGEKMDRIGQETSEQLDIIPAKVQVIRHIRYKYACKECEGLDSEGPTVKIAPKPEQMIPKSIASSGLLAHVLVSKFEDALPFYRQEKMFRRLGVEIPRSTMCGWAIEVARRCEPLLDILHSEILAGPLVRVDETTIQVLKEPGREASTKSYMWLFRGGLPEHPAVVFQYHPTRSGKVPLAYLNDYQGYVQTDGYVGYDELGRQPKIVLLGCWAHSRRKFFDVMKAAKNAKSAHAALNYIGKLYKIEHKADALKLSFDKRKELRQKEAVPILEKFKEWLEGKVDQVPPQSLLGKAIHYTLGQWDRLERYVENGILTPDNNLAENAIRPFVIGRKNWLFNDKPVGAFASATLYSLIETARRMAWNRTGISVIFLNIFHERAPTRMISGAYCRKPST